MVYLYAGLGIAMLSGIMAIFEMGLAVTGQSLFRSPVDSYFTSSRKGVEREFIKDLHDAVWEDEIIPPVEITCENLRKVEDFGEYTWNTLPDGPLKGSCAVTHNRHRIVVGLPSDPPGFYRVYACAVPQDPGECPFEKDP